MIYPTGLRCSANTTMKNPADLPFFNIFLPTFPIFTLFSSYTVVALTLINNIKVLVDLRDDDSPRRHSRLLQYSLPLVAIIPPMVIAFFTEDVSSIVQYVGSYSGTLIQYVFPSLLAYYSRRVVQTRYLVPYLRHKTRTQTSVSGVDLSQSVDVGRLYRTLNPLASPFQSNLWIYGTGVWWILCILLVTLDHLRDLLHLY